MQALLSAGAAVGAEQAHAPCIQCGWQELPPARPQHIPLACRVAGRGRRRRGNSACRLQQILLAGAARGMASAHSVCFHRGWLVLPPARPQRMPLACSVAGRSGRRRVKPLLLTGAAVGKQRAHAPCIHWGWQEKPPVQPQHMLLACIVAGRGGRRRKASRARRSPCTKEPCGSRQGGAPVPRGLADRGMAEPLYRVHKLFLAGAAFCLAGAAGANNERRPLASIVAGRGSRR